MQPTSPRAKDNVSQSHYSFDQYRGLIEVQLLRQKLNTVLAAAIPTTAEQIHVRQILVKTFADAEQVEKRLKAGEDFGEVAQEVSIDPSAKTNSGDLGWAPKGTFVKEFDDAAFALPVLQISDPVTSTFGVHVIQVLAKDANRALDPSILSQKQAVPRTTGCRWNGRWRRRIFSGFSRRTMCRDRCHLLEGVEGLFRNAEDGGQNPGGSLLIDSPMPMLSLGFRRTGVLDDHDLHVGLAAVFEVVEGTLGCEHDVADLSFELLVVSIPVDQGPARNTFGDDVDSPTRWDASAVREYRRVSQATRCWPAGL